MKERDKQQKIASVSKNRDDWVKFKKIRNQINNRLKIEESSWKINKLNECGKDTTKVWKNVKNMLNWKTNGSPSQLF